MNTKRFFAAAVASLAVLCVHADARPAKRSDASVLQYSRMTLADEPLAITRVQVEGVAVDAGAPTKVGKKWAESIVFDVDNTSGREITYAEVDIQIPHKSLVDTVFELRYAEGRLGCSDCKGSSDETIAAGATGHLRLVGGGVVPAEFDSSKARVVINAAVFADGTLWHFGYLHRQDGELWRPIDSQGRFLFELPSERAAAGSASDAASRTDKVETIPCTAKYLGTFLKTCYNHCVAFGNRLDFFAPQWEKDCKAGNAYTNCVRPDGTYRSCEIDEPYPCGPDTN